MAASSVAARVREGQRQKEILVNVVSAAMIKEPKFDVQDQGNVAAKIKHCVDAIAPLDGEFPLKLALYVRDDLGLRGTANLLVALASYHPTCHPFLLPYVRRIAALPSDWLQMATYARDMPFRATAGIPNALRVALAAAFDKFNEYSLAKYNKEGAQKAKAKRLAAAKRDGGRDAESDSDSDDAPAAPYTLKQMIRMLHIDAPRYYVMCLLGKRYPATENEFVELGLQDAKREFDEAKAGCRMRLAVPTTWETQLAAKGNTAAVWEELVRTQQLPFMAMLRNIRNIILAGCDQATHDTIIGRLTSEDQIASSRQFPYRFFSAYDVLKFQWTDVYWTASPNDTPPAKPPPPKKDANGRPVKLKPWPTANPPNDALLQRYREALDRAVQLATALNVRPIHGRTLVGINLTSAIFGNVTAAGGAKGVGSVRTYVDVAVLLGLMFKYACEDCRFFLFCGSNARFVSFPRNGKILENMATVLELAQQAFTSDPDFPDFPFAEVEDIIAKDEPLDAMVIIDAGHKVYRNTRDAVPTTSPVAPGLTMPLVLAEARRSINPNLLFVSVDVTGTAGDGVADAYCDDNDVLIAGFSDSILRFVAERGGGGPLAYIERIDEVKKLDTSAAKARLATITAPPPASTTHAYAPSDEVSSSGLDEEEEEEDGASAASAVGPKVPRRHLSRYLDCRFFLSSTFLDMTNERDALVLEVFPALRRRCLQHGVKAVVSEVDLRWGITSEDAASHMTLSVCLNEVARCAPFYLGMVGARRGYVPSSYDFTKPEGSPIPDEHFKWLESAKPGMSITELEFRQARASTEVLSGHGHPMPPVSGVLLVRDSVVTGNTVPNSHKRLFTDTPEATKATKAFISSTRRTEGVRCARYRAPFAGLGPRDTITLDMDDFKQRALAELWAAVCAAAGYDPNEPEDEDVPRQEGDGLSDERAAQATHEHRGAQSFVARSVEIDLVTDFVAGGVFPSTDEDGQVQEATRVLHVTGAEGIGKSALLCAAAQRLKAELPMAVTIHHSFGAGDRSPLTAVRRLVADVISNLALDADAASIPETTDEAAENVRKALLAGAKRARIVVLLDDLEKCPDSEGLMKLLPALLPAPMPLIDVRFVVATQPSTSFATALRSRRPPPRPLVLEPLEVEDRAAVLRAHLRLLGRKLQESASRGNQLAPLTKKADAGKPGFLVQALTFLRLFASFDTLDREIRYVGSSCTAIQTDVLARLEKRFGVALCRPVLQALYLSSSVGGMLEIDAQRQGPPGTVAQARQLLYAIEPVVRWTDGVLCLTDPGVTIAIAKRYFRGRDDKASSHARLCEFYSSSLRVTEGGSRDPGQTVESLKPTFKSIRDTPAAAASSTANADARKELPYERLSGRSLLCLMHHSLGAKQYETVEAMITSVACIETIIEAELLPQLLVAVAALEQNARLVFRKVQPFVDFLLQHRHILLNHRHLTLQSALNMPERSPVWNAAMRLGEGVRESRAMALWQNRSEHGESDCVQTTCITRREVLAAAFDDTGKVLAVGGKDWCCRLFNVYDGTVLHTLKHPNDVTVVILLRTMVVTGCQDGVVRVWSRSDGSLTATGTGHTKRVNQIAVHPQGAYILSAADDGTVRRWSVSNESSRLRNVGQPSRKHGAPVSCVAIHSGGKVNASGGWEGRAYFWAYEKETKPVWFNTKRRCAVRAIAFNASMVVIAAVASYDGGVDLFDYAGEVHQATLSPRHLGAPLTSIEYSADGKRMLTADIRGTMKLWRASVTGELIASYSAHERAVQCARFDPANPFRIVSASHDSTVRHWQAPGDGDERNAACHAAAVSGVAYAPDGSFVVTASRDGVARVIDLGTNKGSLMMLFEHAGRFTALAIAADSRSIITGDHQGTVCCWDSRPGVGGRDGHVRWTLRNASPVVDIHAAADEPFVWATLRNGCALRISLADGSLQTTARAALPGGVGASVLLPDQSLVAWGSTANRTVFKPNASAAKVTAHCDDSTTWATCAASSFVDDVNTLYAFGNAHGWIFVFDHDSAARGCEPSEAFVTAELHDEFSRASAAPVRINSMSWCSSAMLAVGCSDRTLRIFNLDRDLRVLVPCYMFFATAPVTAVGVCRSDGIVTAGDALGNIYHIRTSAPKLELQPRPAPDRPASEHRSTTAPSSTHSAIDELWDLGDDDSDDAYGAPTAEDAELAKYDCLEAFHVITVDVPPSVRGAARREWFLEQRKVLKIAMRLQRRVPAARVAMRMYAQRSMQLMSAYNRLAAAQPAAA